MDCTITTDGNGTAYLPINTNTNAIVGFKNWNEMWLLFIPFSNNNSGQWIVKVMNLLDLSIVSNAIFDARIFYLTA